MKVRQWVIAGSILALAPSKITAQHLVPQPPGGPYCQSTELCQAYRHVYFTTSGLGYVASEAALLRTTDGGATWSPLIGLLAARRVSIQELFFVNESIFFSYGSEFLRTTDRGSSFTRISLVAPIIDDPHDTDEAREGFFFLDAQRGWALGNHQFLFTYDGGITWGSERMRIPQPRELWMFDAQQGIAVRPAVARTDDGGGTWRAVAGSPQIDRVRCVGRDFCVGTRFPDPIAYVSVDAGETWRATNTGIDRDKDTVYDVQAIASGGAVLVGTHIDQRRAVLRNIDPRTPLPVVPTPMPYRGLLVRWDGSSWHRTEYPDIETLWTVHYVTATDVWASADTNGILHSTDGAQTWTFVPDYYRQIAALTPSPVPFVVPTPPPTP